MADALNIEARRYRDADGFTHPVTHWFDINNADCDPEEAIKFVAGSEGRWFGGLVEDYNG